MQKPTWLEQKKKTSMGGGRKRHKDVCAYVTYCRVCTQDGTNAHCTLCVCAGTIHTCIVCYARRIVLLSVHRRLRWAAGDRERDADRPRGVTPPRPPRAGERGGDRRGERDADRPLRRGVPPPRSPRCRPRTMGECIAWSRAGCRRWFALLSRTL